MSTPVVAYVARSITVALPVPGFNFEIYDGIGTDSWSLVTFNADQDNQIADAVLQGWNIAGINALSGSVYFTRSTPPP